MINSRLLITNFEEISKKLATKGVSRAQTELCLKRLNQRNQLIKDVEALRSQKNELSKKVGELINQKKDASQIKKNISALKLQLQKKEDEMTKAEIDFQNELLGLPNIPSDKTPLGSKPSDNVILDVQNFNPKDFENKTIPPHFEIAEKFQLFDQERAAKITGSMFMILKGQGAKLLRSLIAYGFELFENDYKELIVPSMVNSKTFTGTGHLPKFHEEAYHIEKDDFWLIPTGEVPLTALHQNEILKKEDLPLKYMTYTPCFRREAGSAGSDTRGLKRLHEFHKLELVKICCPEDSENELETLLADALRPIKELKLPYRVLDLCAGDLTFASARTYDIEIYSPGTNQWLEVSSVGLFTDYQTRRCHIRFRDENRQIRLPHSLNASGLATPRVWAAILENGLLPDGRIQIPEPLKPFMKADYMEPAG